MKKALTTMLIALLFLAVFNFLFFFIGGTDHPKSVWISYGFIHFAYIGVWLLPRIMGTKHDSNYYLSAPVYSLCLNYFIVEFIVGLVFILIRLESIAWPLCVQVIICCIFMFLILGLARFNQATGEQMIKREAEIAVYRSACMEIKKLLSRASFNPTLAKLVNTCHDKMEASASRQTAETEQVDNNIMSTVSSLRQAMISKDADASIAHAEDLLALIEERRDILKYSH